MTPPATGLEDDPRCQPGAYIQLDDTWMYRVLWVNNGWVRVEDCRHPDLELYLLPENIRAMTLVKAAPAPPQAAAVS